MGQSSSSAGVNDTLCWCLKQNWLGRKVSINKDMTLRPRGEYNPLVQLNARPLHLVSQEQRAGSQILPQILPITAQWYWGLGMSHWIQESLWRNISASSCFPFSLSTAAMSFCGAELQLVMGLSRVINCPSCRRTGTGRSRQVCGVGDALWELRPCSHWMMAWAGRQLWSDPSWLPTQILPGLEHKLPGMPAAQSTPTSWKNQGGISQGMGRQISPVRGMCTLHWLSPYAGSAVLPSGHHSPKLDWKRLWLCPLKTHTQLCTKEQQSF